MSRELTQTVRDQIAAAPGEPTRLLARKLGISKSAVAKVRAELAASSAGTKRPEAAAPSAPVHVDTRADGAPVPVVSLRDPEGVLSLAERAAGIGLAQQNPAAINSAIRSAIATQAEQRKAAPPPQKNPDELPDMVEAARRCREEMYRSLDRLADELEEAKARLMDQQP